MKRCLMILTDGYEEIEALGTYAILARGGVNISLYSLRKKDIVGSNNLPYLKDLPIFNLSKFNINDYDGLIIAGGKEYIELSSSFTFNEVIKYFYDNHKMIGAICAGPTLLGNLGYLENKRFTCFKSMNPPNSFNGTFIDSYVVRDNNIITAISAAASIDFGFTILEYLYGHEHAEKVKESIYYYSK